MSKTKILIVEDEAIVARDLSMHLKELGYDPIACTQSGEEALSLAERLHPDLVLMDIQLMGPLDGVSAAQKIREQLSLPVVFLTAFTGEAILDRAKQAEPFGYIIKPFESRELKTAIEIALYRYKAEKEIQDQREAMSAIIRTAIDGFIMTDMDGRFLDVNDAYCRMVGYSKEELMKKSFLDMTADDSAEDILEGARQLIQKKFITLERRHRCRDGSFIHFELSANYLPASGGRIFSFLRDITDRKCVEAERLATLRLLEIINRSRSLHELMRSVTLLLRDWSGCDAVGIRLRQDDDFPYFETRGFPVDFIKLENQLCLYGPDGQPIRDENGNPLLECMCGNILSGRFDPSKPFFTPHGSFWSNATTELLATTRDTDRQARTRNRCNGEGYETVALIPLRVGETTYGLLQLNDKRPGQLSLEKISLLEHLGDNLALAVAHRTEMENVIKSERKFRSYVDNAPVGIAIVDRAGRYHEVNPSMTELLGYSSQEFLEMRLFDLRVSTHISENQHSFDILKERGAHSVEIQMKKKDGTPIWVFMHAVQLAEDRFLGFHIDITSRKKMEQRLILNEAELMSIYDNVPIMIGLLDEDSRMVRLNSAAVHFTGLPESDLLNRRCGEIFGCVHSLNYPWGCGYGSHCQECALNKAIRNTIQKGDRAVFVEIEINRKSQGQIKKHWINGSTARLNIQGQVRVLLFVEDVTEHVLSIKRIREQAALLDVSHDAIMVSDLQGRVQYLNKAAQELFGWNSEDAEATACKDILSPASDRQWEIMFENTMTGGSWNGELLLHSKMDQQIVLDSRWTLVRDANGNPQSVLIVSSDITNRKQLEAQFLRAQRFESLGFLASGVAHDLNNILSPILMGGSVLESVLSDEENQSILTSMMEAVRRGSDTVKQLLTFARGGEGERILVQPRHLLKEIGRLLKQTLPKNIQVYTDFSPNLNNVHADPSQLHQVLMNLCVNARDAMPDGGVLTIAIENCNLGEDALMMHPKAVKGDYVVFKVSDTGCGIAQEVIDRVFDPFFTTKPQGQGTGLGLATVLGIVHGHGGFILTDSLPGKGTTFRIYFPAMPHGIDKPAPVQESTAMQGQGEMILVVDDEAGIRRLLRGVLERRGYKVLIAESVMEALELYRKHQVEIRVVLTDMVMPFVDGNDFIVQLRAIDPFLKIIAISGLATHSQKNTIMTTGANVFLRKPLEIEQLMIALRDLMDSEKIPMQ
jgi:PAS domain S-box-containing protein